MKKNKAKSARLTFFLIRLFITLILLVANRLPEILLDHNILVQEGFLSATGKQ
jgi:hypothetical protein